jgi:hypothetical protein
MSLALNRISAPFPVSAGTSALNARRNGTTEAAATVSAAAQNDLRFIFSSPKLESYLAHRQPHAQQCGRG